MIGAAHGTWRQPSAGAGEIARQFHLLGPTLDRGGARLQRGNCETSKFLPGRPFFNAAATRVSPCEAGWFIGGPAAVYAPSGRTSVAPLGGSAPSCARPARVGFRRCEIPSPPPRTPRRCDQPRRFSRPVRHRPARTSGAARRLFRWALQRGQPMSSAVRSRCTGWAAVSVARGGPQ